MEYSNRKNDNLNTQSLCKTKFPIVLVHGTGSRDRELFNYWGRIPKALEQEGASIYYCYQDAWGTIEENAKVIKQRIKDILSNEGCKKVNVIAHSKGGLDVRYAISALGMEEEIASLTTISTPHYGSKTIDFVCKIPRFIMKAVAYPVDIFCKLLGDKTPDFYTAFQQFNTSSARKFNDKVQNSQKVYYQSYASLMKKSYSDILLFLPHLIVNLFDGDCDGIVSVESASWGEFKGVITCDGIRGVSHADIIDARRIDIKGLNIRGFYIGIVSELKEKGF